MGRISTTTKLHDYKMASAIDRMLVIKGLSIQVRGNFGLAYGIAQLLDSNPIPNPNSENESIKAL